MDTFSYSVEDLVNQYALLGIPILFIVIGTLIARFSFRG